MVTNTDSDTVWDNISSGQGTHKGECVMCVGFENLNIHGICKECWVHYRLSGTVAADIGHKEMRIKPQENKKDKPEDAKKDEPKDAKKDEPKEDKKGEKKVAKYKLVDVEEDMLPEIISLHKLTYPAKIPDDHYEKLYKGFKENNSPFIVALNEHYAMVGYVACRVKQIAEKKKWVGGKNVVDEPAQTHIMLSAIASFEGYTDSEDELIDEVIKQSKKLKVEKIITHVRGQHKEFRKFLEGKRFKGVRVGKYTNQDEKIEYVYHLVKRKAGSKRGSNTKTAPKPKVKSKPKVGWFKVARVTKKHLPQIMAIHNKSMVKQRKITYFDKLYESSNRLIWVAVDSNGDVVGYIAGRQGRLAGLEAGPKDRINLVGMAVKDEWRRLGIADKLWKIFVSSCMFIKDAKFIYGHVRESNFEASNLYQKLGFKRKRIGKYDDTGEYKYLIVYRLKYINLTPYYLKYKKPIHAVGFFGLGYALNEIVDIFMND